MVVVAMSGGVDSSVVAAMLHYKGLEVIGVTLKLHDFYDESISCCGGSSEIRDAKLVASKIGIKHYVLDLEENFKKNVIDNFVNSYSQGLTPSPCIRCNQFVKFQDLYSFAKQIGAEYLATGHYVQKIFSTQNPELHTAKDLTKDQSYFLFTTTNEQLDFLEFPLGNYDKSSTRIMAQKFGLHLADKKDSQDICFIPSNDYRSLLKKHLSPKKGNIIHIEGFHLGTHLGVMNYTVGQRKAISISWSEALYVIKIDYHNNDIYVGPEKYLFKKSFTINQINILDSKKICYSDSLIDVSIKVRSSMKSTPARIKLLNEDSILVFLLHDVKSVAPGQACVIYDNTQMLGGGWIS